MDRADALATIQDVAAEVLSVEPGQVTEGARFKEDLDADSLDLVELVMGLEERFDIEVPEDDLEGVTTVGQAVDLVLTKVGSYARARRRRHRRTRSPASRDNRARRQDAGRDDPRRPRVTTPERTVDRRHDPALRPVSPRRPHRV